MEPNLIRLIFGVSREAALLIELNFLVFMIAAIPFFIEATVSEQITGRQHPLDRFWLLVCRYFLKPMGIAAPVLFIYEGRGPQIYWGLWAALVLVQMLLIFQPSVTNLDRPQPQSATSAQTKLDIKKHNKRIEQSASSWASWGNYLMFGCFVVPLIGLLYRGDPLALPFGYFVPISLLLIAAAVVCHWRGRQLLDRLKEEKSR